MRPHRLRGIASECHFQKKWYEFIEDESYQLIQPTLDYGWDFMVNKNKKKIQVKRFSPMLKRYNPNTLDLRRKRNKGTGDYTCKEFDYLVVHNTIDDSIIVSSVDQLKKRVRVGKQYVTKMKSAVLIYDSIKTKGLVNEGLEALL
jgi:hypothetical protein